MVGLLAVAAFLALIAVVSQAIIRVDARDEARYAKQLAAIGRIRVVVDEMRTQNLVDRAEFIANYGDDPCERT